MFNLLGPWQNCPHQSRNIDPNQGLPRAHVTGSGSEWQKPKLLEALHDSVRLRAHSSGLCRVTWTLLESLHSGSSSAA